MFIFTGGWEFARKEETFYEQCRIAEVWENAGNGTETAQRDQKHGGKSGMF